jgi:hypothetical protein
MSRLSAKLDQTLDVSMRLLTLVEKTNYTYIVRKILEEEGITVNLLPKKVKESEAAEEEKPKPAEPKQKGFLWFGKPAPGKDESPGKKP